MQVSGPQFIFRSANYTTSNTNPGGGTRPENGWGCGAGRWKLDPKRSRKKLNLGPKRSIFVKIGSFCTPKDSFAVGGWEKVPQKDRARSCQSEKRGSKPRHICITHHIGSTPRALTNQRSYLISYLQSFAHQVGTVEQSTVMMAHWSPGANKLCSGKNQTEAALYV